MLTVRDYELIRRKHFREGQSVRSIARELGHSRKTVAKALRNSAPPGYQQSKPRAKPMLDPFRGTIEAWLEADRTAPRKQRHSSQRIFERLRDEHGFPGSASTVRRYVASLAAKPSEVFLPLHFAPGEEAQVDWGEATVVMNGVERRVQLFCMKLCHSHAVFVRAYERADMESFLDGHVRALNFFGGVPRRIAYDNLKTAVIRVGKGRERELNERFIELRSHYLFDTRFCNVAKGNEKGHVENLVKRSQRTFLTPVPEVSDLAALNAKLETDCLAERTRKDQQGRSYAELFDVERPSLLSLPARPFQACSQRPTRVDKQCLVQFDDHLYSVPVCWAYHPCLVRAFVDRVEIYCDHACVATHVRAYDGPRHVLDPMHYLPVLERKPGALDHGLPFQGNPWGDEFLLLRRELEYRLGGDGTRQFIQVLLLMTEHPPDQVRSAVSCCVAQRIFSLDAIRAAMRNEPTPCRSPRLDLSDHPELAAVGEGIRSTADYDALLRESEEKAA